MGRKLELIEGISEKKLKITMYEANNRAHSRDLFIS